MELTEQELLAEVGLLAVEQRIQARTIQRLAAANDDLSARLAEYEGSQGDQTERASTG